METQELKRIEEALIFAADEPLSADRIAETLELENGFDLGALIEELNREYQESNRAFTIRQLAGGYQIVTQQNYASWIRKLYLGRQKTRLSHAALETLALIAFKQPISRVEVAQIRGVNSDAVIGTLLERKLITISGRSETVGRPLLYSTTPEFLKYFGINDIADLPKPREIEELFSKEGMPEELLQALSQTDAQLSLPINVDSETPAPSEDAEIKTATSIASAPQPTATTSNPANDIPNDHQESTAVSSIDINEEVVTLLEDSPKADPLSASSSLASANESENEIAWISLNNDANNQAEHFTGAELSVDELTETSNGLPTFASVTEVVSATAAKSSSIEAMMEEVTADFVRTDAVADNRHDLAQETFVAEVKEIVEMAAESASAELQVIEVNDAGFSDEQSPSELKAGLDDEVDGWLAEELSQEEIAEPDFLRQADDFFLEDSRQREDSAAAIDLEENAASTGPEPVVVSTAMLASVADEIFQNIDGALFEPEIKAEAQNELRADSTPDSSLSNEVEKNIIDALPEPLPEPSTSITIVDFDEPKIVEAGAETAAKNSADAGLPRLTEEILLPTMSEIVSSTSEQESIAVEAELPNSNSVLEAKVPNDANIVDEAASHRADLKHESFHREVANGLARDSINEAASARETMVSRRSITLRTRMTGWIKRAFDKLMTLVGAKF
jgi:segregation and condensation protein B